MAPCIGSMGTTTVATIRTVVTMEDDGMLVLQRIEPCQPVLNYQRATCCISC